MPARGHADVWLQRPQACAALRPARSTQEQLSAYYMDTTSATKKLTLIMIYYSYGIYYYWLIIYCCFRRALVKGCPTKIVNEVLHIHEPKWQFWKLKPKRCAFLQKWKLGLDCFDFNKARSSYARLVLCFFPEQSWFPIEGFLEVSSKGGSAVDSGDRCFYAKAHWVPSFVTFRFEK